MAENRFAFMDFAVFARLAPDTGIAEASAAINALYSRIIEERESQPPFPELGAPRTLLLEPGANGQRAETAGTFAQPLALLLGLTLVVLLVVCSNVVASLLLVRGAVPDSMTAPLPEELSRPAILFTAGASLATVLLFGAAPAIQASRAQTPLTVRHPGPHRFTSRGVVSWRNTLSIAQIAFSTVLLVLAALFAQSLANITRLDLGIDVDSVVTFTGSYSRKKRCRPNRTVIGKRERACVSIPRRGFNEAAASRRGNSRVDAQRRRHRRASMRPRHSRRGNPAPQRRRRGPRPRFNEAAA